MELPSVSPFRRKYHHPHHYHHHHHHHPWTKSSLSGQTQAAWKDEFQGMTSKLFLSRPATVTRRRCRAKSSSRVTMHVHAALYVAVVSWHCSTAMKQADKAYWAPSTYSLQAWEILEMWGQRWGDQGSVEDDTEHRARAAGWKPIRVWLRLSSFITAKDMWLVTTLLGQE